MARRYFGGMSPRCDRPAGGDFCSLFGQRFQYFIARTKNDVLGFDEMATGVECHPMGRRHDAFDIHWRVDSCAPRYCAPKESCCELYGIGDRRVGTENGARAVYAKSRFEHSSREILARDTGAVARGTLVLEPS